MRRHTHGAIESRVRGDRSLAAGALVGAAANVQAIEKPANSAAPRL